MGKDPFKFQKPEKQAVFTDQDMFPYEKGWPAFYAEKKIASTIPGQLVMNIKTVIRGNSDDKTIVALSEEPLEDIAKTLSTCIPSRIHTDVFEKILETPSDIRKAVVRHLVDRLPKYDIHGAIASDSNYNEWLK